MPRSPGIAALLESVLADDRAGLHVALPGRVESYDSTKQVADIKPMLQAVVRGVDDAREVDAHPVVPVAFPRSGNFYLSFPLVKGDTGLLVFCEADLSPWRATGEDSDPLDEGKHTLAGAVFFPGLHTEEGALTTPPAHPVLGRLAGGVEVHFDSTLQLGAAGGQFVALANLVLDRLNSIKTAFDAHVHTGVTTGGGSSGPPAAPMGAPAIVAAVKVKDT